MVSEKSGVAVVVRQEGDRLRVVHRGQELDVPMVGFPPGYQLRAGERVSLLNEPAARPLVQAVEAEVDLGSFEQGAPLSIGGRDLALEANTVVYEGDAARTVVWTVDPGTSEGPERIIAIRKGR